MIQGTLHFRIRRMTKRFTNLAGLIVVVLFTVFGCGTSSSGPNFAFITNGVADFWEHAEAGAEKAGKDLSVEVTVIMPSSITDQTRKIEDLLVRGTDGIANSPIAPEDQGEILNTAASQTNLITHDS